MRRVKTSRRLKYHTPDRGDVFFKYQTTCPRSPQSTQAI
jgi:hypothetical protein